MKSFLEYHRELGAMGFCDPSAEVLANMGDKGILLARALIAGVPSDDIERITPRIKHLAFNDILMVSQDGDSFMCNLKRRDGRHSVREIKPVMVIRGYGVFALQFDRILPVIRVGFTRIVFYIHNEKWHFSAWQDDKHSFNDTADTKQELEKKFREHHLPLRHLGDDHTERVIEELHNLGHRFEGDRWRPITANTELLLETERENGKVYENVYIRQGDLWIVSHNR